MMKLAQDILWRVISNIDLEVTGSTIKISKSAPWWVTQSQRLGGDRITDPHFHSQGVFILDELLYSYRKMFGTRYDEICFFHRFQLLRPRGSPQEDGPGAQKWPNGVQRVFYNEWKSIHGLKHQQTVENALGFTFILWIHPTSRWWYDPLSRL